MESEEAWARVESLLENLAKGSLDWALFPSRGLFQDRGMGCKTAPTTVDSPVQLLAMALVRGPGCVGDEGLGLCIVYLPHQILALQQTR